MIEYKELYLSKINNLCVEVSEVEKFLPGIRSILHAPQDDKTVYIISAPIYNYLTGEYTSILNLINEVGWEYNNTYYNTKEDKVVMTFIKK